MHVRFTPDSGHRALMRTRPSATATAPRSSSGARRRGSHAAVAKARRRRHHCPRRVATCNAIVLAGGRLPAITQSIDLMSVIGGKADMAIALQNVRFLTQSGHRRSYNLNSPRRSASAYESRYRRRRTTARLPSHFLMREWSFAIFARNLSLQALRQKRSAQCWWQTRPNLPPQVVQRFSNLVMSFYLRFGSCSRHACQPRDWDSGKFRGRLSTTSAPCASSNPAPLSCR